LQRAEGQFVTISSSYIARKKVESIFKKKFCIEVSELGIFKVRTEGA